MEHQVELMPLISEEVTSSEYVNIAKSLNIMGESIKNIETMLSSMYTNTDSVYTSINGTMLSEGKEGFTELNVNNMLGPLHIKHCLYDAYIAHSIIVVESYGTEPTYLWVNFSLENDRALSKIILAISDALDDNQFEIKESVIRERIKGFDHRLSIFDIKLIVLYYNAYRLYHGSKCEMRLIIGE